jgi:hypothetical protein
MKDTGSQIKVYYVTEDWKGIIKDATKASRKYKPPR